MRYAHSNDDPKRRAVQKLVKPANDNAEPKAASDNHPEHGDKKGTVLPKTKKS
jgi:hypothetical protein